jgi:hypothetical protein
MKHIKTKTIIGSMLFSALFSAASVAAVRYDFTEQVDFRFPKPTSQLISGYYIFDETTPVTLSNPIDPGPHPPRGYYTGIFDDPILEMGVTYQGESSVFNTCLSASCSEIKLESYPHEEYYSVRATLLDSTGTRSATFGLGTRDMGRGGLDVENIDDVGAYSSPGAEWGFLGFSFETLDGQELRLGGQAWTIVSAGSVSISEPTPLLLIGIGLAVFGFARTKHVFNLLFHTK